MIDAFSRENAIKPWRGQILREANNKQGSGHLFTGETA